MRGVSTFGAFTTARLGIIASQKALEVTGHNITNINTAGYTRQRLDQMSLRVGGNDRYASQNDAIVGSGVLCTGVSQLRDPYLDIRYRNEQSSVGAMDTKLSGLEEISSILDEVAKGNGKGILEASFNDLVSQLHNLSLNAGKDEFDALVRSSANSLTKLLNNYANQLSTVQKNQDLSFHQDIDTVNGILKNISDLNNTISKSEIHGDSALELKDQRNLLIDKLSQYVKITVKTETVSVGAGKEVNNLIIKLAGTPKGDAAKSTSTLVNGNYAAQLSIRQVPKKNELYDSTYDPTLPGNDLLDPRAFQYVKADGTFTKIEAEAKIVDSPNYDLDLSALKNPYGTVYTDPKTKLDSTAVSLGDLDLYGSLQAARELLTEAGEYTNKDVITGATAYDTNAATKRGIPYYQKALDSLAKKLSDNMNEANSGYLVDTEGNYVGTDGKPLVDGATTFTKGMDLKVLTQNPYFVSHSVKLGGALFSNSEGDATKPITAANISISKGWSTGEVHILNSKIMGSTPGKPNSSANENIVHMQALIDGKHAFCADEVSAGSYEGDKAFFTGSFQEMLANVSGTLANDVKSTSVLLNNYSASATEINVSRSAVSSVDLNDEAANLMQYQKSYAAACRLMTTLDEALDKLINGTGVVGR